MARIPYHWPGAGEQAQAYWQTTAPPGSKKRLISADQIVYHHFSSSD
jgi:hypothetical protein